MFPDNLWFNETIALKIGLAVFLWGIISLEREINGHAARLKDRLNPES